MVCYSEPVEASKSMDTPRNPICKEGFFNFMALKLIPFYGSLLGVDLSENQEATQSHILVYGAIEAHAMGAKGCIASNKTIAYETGLSVGRLANILTELNKAKWINVVLDDKNHRLAIVPLLTLNVRVNPPSQESEPPLHAGVNIDNTIDNNKNKPLSSGKPDLSGSVKAEASGEAKPESVSPALGKDVGHQNRVLFFRELCKVFGHTEQTIFTPKREAHMRRRLENFKPSEIMQAAKNLIKSDWHTGSNPSKTMYAKYDFLVRDDEKVEEWLNKTPVNKPKSAF